MRWFERHLNWSLFFAIILIPLVVGIVFSVIALLVLGGYVATMIAGDIGSETPPEFLAFLFSTMLPLALVSLVVGLGLFVWEIIAILWYLGQKARSKGFIMLIFGPSIFSVILGLLNTGIIGSLITLITALGCLIALFLLENHAIGYGGDIGYEPATAGLSDGGGGYGVYGGYDERQLKELDYTPSQNVLDISGDPLAKDVNSMADVPDAGGGGADRGAGEEIPPEKVIPKPATHERPSMPILLDDDGNVIRCAYHPGADAVNMCSRCGQYVCAECNYVTGTHPICRNCWERKTEVPLAPPTQKQARPVPSRPVEQQKTAEPPMPTKQEEPAPTEPEVPPVSEVAEPVEQIPVEPAAQPEQEAVAPAKAEEPLAEAAVKSEVQPDITAVKPEEPIILTPIKPTKQDVETIKWQQEFMAIYQQASPIINVIIRKGDDGMPSSPLDLMEGLKLRPMMALVKKLSKPKDKELREAKSELEQVLSSCIKIADAAADFVGGGGHALLGGPDFKRIVDGLEKASGLMGKLSRRLPAFSRPQ